ncbi:MAG: M13 family metallopeptidase [Bacteroidales bacterium]|jgi:putative endopeptidase|nr:M13 family metallopeptidase [Bacteroidales bacterium]
MKHFFLISAVVLFAATGCKNDSMKTLNLNDLDTSVNPKDDFYDFACGGWMKNHPLTDEYARYGSFDAVSEITREQCKTIVEDLAKNISKNEGLARKTGVVYNLAMDTVRLNIEGYEPIKDELSKIAEISTREELFLKWLELNNIGISPLLAYYVAPDESNSKVNLFQFYQSGIGMPDRDYYLLNDPRNVEIRDAYINYIKQLFTLCGDNEQTAAAKAKQVMEVETALAKAMYSRVELRDPKKNFNKMSVAELQKLCPQIDWTKYLLSLAPDGVAITEVNAGQIPFLKEIGNLFAKADLETLKTYFEWNFIGSAAGYLSDDFVNAQFEFYGKKIQGKKEIQPRWKRAMNAVNGVMGEGLGKIYVERYFPASSKERMLALVNNLIATMGERFNDNVWMSEETKTRAKEKLSNILVKIGYPDKWRDYSALDIDENKSYWTNIIRSNIFDIDYMMSKVNKEVDRDEWHMSPQTVNAYYNPTTNEICFPAGILQPPFFYADGDDAINYGAIGVVIGHELTHGFDDQGRQYDKDGNLYDWWANGDEEKFNERAAKVVERFNNIIVIDSMHANGEFTLGENIADNGGLNISFNAFEKVAASTPQKSIGGYTPEQRFFLAYAAVWANNIRDEEIRHRTMTDPHALGKWRVNGTLPNVEAFVKTWDIKEGDGMWLAPEKRALIW